MTLPIKIVPRVAIEEAEVESLVPLRSFDVCCAVFLFSGIRVP
jgi:hypothetical protein